MSSGSRIVPRPSAPARIIVAILTATVAVAVMATRVYDEFPRVRQRVVRDPIEGRAGQPLNIALPDIQGMAGAPAALIVDAESSGADGDTLSVMLDGRAIAAVPVTSGRRRIDLSALYAPGSHVLAVTSQRASWTLRGLEVANVHGFSNWPFELVVIPRSRAAVPPPLWVILASLALLVSLAARAWPPIASRRARWLFRVAAGLAFGICAAVLATPWLSAFSILLSRRTFVLIVALLFGRHLLGVASAVTRVAWPVLAAGVGQVHAGLEFVIPRLVMLARRYRRVVPHLIVAGIVMHGVGQFWRPSVGFTRLIAFGDQFAGQAVPALARIPHAIEVASAGYDGQFYAQMAFDPLLTDPATLAAMDSPGYRARRMFMPLVASLGGLGHPPWVLQVYAVLNILCWMAFALLVFHWAPAGSSRTFAVWAACVVSPGWDASIRRALTDGPSVLLLACAVLAVERARNGTGGGILGLAALTREASLLNGVILLPRRLGEYRVRSLLSLVWSALPLGLWLLYLRRLGLQNDGGINAVALPLSAIMDHGVIAVAELVTDGSSPCGFAKLSTLVGLAVQAAYIGWHRRWASPWWRIGAVHGIFMLVLGSAVWDGCPGAATRALLPLTIAFNLELLQAGRTFWLWWILGNTGILAGSELVGTPAAIAFF